MDSLQVARTQAAWYAWGQMDSGKYVGLPLDAAEFADIYAKDYEAYLDGKTMHLASIQNHWLDYVRDKRSQ